MKYPSVIVTGCSKGIGLQVVLDLIREGYYIFSIGRSQPELPAELTRNFSHLECDFSQALEAVKVSRWIQASQLQNDFLGFIHLAGVGHKAPILDATIESMIEQVNVNLVSAISLTRIILPFLNRHRSRIFFLGSRARRFAFLGGAAYCASKAGLYALSDCLALEARELGWNIGVTIFEFGPVATGFGGLEKSNKQISSAGAASIIVRAFIAPLDDYDVRVVEVVPSVKRLKDD